MNKLASYLKEHGITQSQFAADAGLDQSFVSRLCAGSASVSVRTGFRIEAITGGKVPASSWVDTATPAPVPKARRGKLVKARPANPETRA